MKHKTLRMTLWSSLAFALMWLVFAVALFVTRTASAQPPTCTALSTASPIPWNEARLTWVLPTQNTDGSALNPATVQVAVYRRTGASGTFAVQCLTAAGALGASMLNQPVGSQNYAVTARVGPTGPESVQTNAVVKNIIVVPQPPTSLAVQTDLTAWAIDETENRGFFTEVGRVQPGTQCDTQQSITLRGVTRYVVPRDRVTFFQGANPQMVLAACG